MTFEAGQTLSNLTKPPITRTTLALYCGASHDHNPIHVDMDAARAIGLSDVIGHGMLTMAYMGQCLTAVFQQDQIRQFQTRFISPTHIGDEITCQSVVRSISDGDHPEQMLEIDITACDQNGQTKAVGTALITLA